MSVESDLQRIIEMYGLEVVKAALDQKTEGVRFPYVSEHSGGEDAHDAD